VKERLSKLLDHLRNEVFVLLNGNNLGYEELPEQLADRVEH
jgi:hypothetical protein